MAEPARNMGQPATPYTASSNTIHEDIEIPGSITSPQQTQKSSTVVTAVAEQNSQFQSQENNLGALTGADSHSPNSVYIDIPGQVIIHNQNGESKTSESGQQTEISQKQSQSKTNEKQVKEKPEKIQVPSETYVPKAPKLDKMDKIVGYESITFIGALLPPPVPTDSKGQEPIRDDFANFPTLSALDVRNAYVESVDDHCCNGKRAARNMAFDDIKNASAVHYTLETFTERREVLWAFKPYSGEEFDSPANGSAPGPWEVSVPMNEPYANKVMIVEVPHTASLRLCHDCGGSGKKICGDCSGRGQISCPDCHGKGRKTEPKEGQCFWCGGTGKDRCNRCGGTGQRGCKSCVGKKQLKWFIKLKCYWKVHLLDYVIEKTSVSNDLVKAASGQIIFEEEALRVWPISNFPDDELNIASYNCVQKHLALQNVERVVSQRQKIRAIPVAQVSYKGKEKVEYFYVYGFEKKVYSPYYPERCCWGCNIA